MGERSFYFIGQADEMKTQALRQALDKHGFDAAFGARRDEEKCRARERISSLSVAA